MARGDHIRVYRNLYFHHGIDCGDGSVIHFTGEVGAKTNAAIKRTPWSEFVKDGLVERAIYRQRNSSQEVIRRAKSRLGETDYNLVFNNCEHFATWCVTGEHGSAQVKTVGAVAAGLGVVLATQLFGGLRPHASRMQRFAVKNVQRVLQDGVTWEPLRPSLPPRRKSRAKRLTGS